MPPVILVASKNLTGRRAIVQSQGDAGEVGVVLTKHRELARLTPHRGVPHMGRIHRPNYVRGFGSFFLRSRSSFLSDSSGFMSSGIVPPILRIAVHRHQVAGVTVQEVINNAALSGFAYFDHFRRLAKMIVWILTTFLARTPCSLNRGQRWFLQGPLTGAAWWGDVWLSSCASGRAVQTGLDAMPRARKSWVKSCPFIGF